MVRSWREAATVGDVLDLSARWLEGRAEFHPAFGVRRGDHLGRLSRPLAGAARAGWLVQDYQPGVSTSEAEQRAYLVGYASRDLSTWIRNVALDLGLAVDVRASHMTARPAVDVARCGPRVVARIGGRRTGDDLSYYASAGVSPAVLDDIARWPLVTVVDPEWGRADLVPALLQRLTETFGDRFGVEDGPTWAGAAPRTRLGVRHRPRDEDRWVASAEPDGVIPWRPAVPAADPDAGRASRAHHEPDDTIWPTGSGF